MLIKIAALGALGYAGYRYFTTKQSSSGGEATPRIDRGAQAEARRNAVAGGPLTDAAQVQHSPDAPTYGERPQL